MIKIEDVKKPQENQDYSLSQAIASLAESQHLLATEIAGTSKWIQIVLFIIRMITYILEHLPVGSVSEKKELEQNQRQLASLNQALASMLRVKVDLVAKAKGTPCGETKV